jgi:fructose-1,6-bisphosphatase
MYSMQHRIYKKGEGSRMPIAPITERQSTSWSSHIKLEHHIDLLYKTGEFYNHHHSYSDFQSCWPARPEGFIREFENQQKYTRSIFDCYTISVFVCY